ncbi:MAG TPA: polyprenyl synthetase family protein [Gemmatimonadaceae bacterium]|nr:polyprenyl synthetase family protein [Gemmatimonadaceae bacterium]
MTTTASERAAIDRAMMAFVATYEPRLGGLAPAIRHALGGGGKRLRGLLTIAAYRACGGSGDAGALAAAVEIVHAYSLVHDDLPCMDDDVVRRGKPTVHVVHGVWPATVAGVAMVPLAARAAMDACAALALDDTASRAIVARLMRASGAGGMVGGQLLDLLGEGRETSLDGLETIHRGKTASLIAAAASIGGEAAGAPADRVMALEAFGNALGLAFQIMDDLLDVTSTTETLGKTAGRDTALRKSTYPGLVGLGPARAMAERKVEEARNHLAAAGILTDALAGFARFVVQRES